MFLSRATFISAAIVVGVVTQAQAQCPPSNDNGQCKFLQLYVCSLYDCLHDMPITIDR